MNQISVKQLHQKRMKLWEASISNHKKYIDNATGLFKDEHVIYRDCPVCDKNDHVHLFHKEGGTYVKCLHCSMVYTNPVLTDNALEEYYTKNHSVQAQIVENGDDSFYENIYNEGLNSIEKLTSPGLILDVGCSSGFFLDLAQKRGWQTFGLELNVQEAAMAKKKGHLIYGAPLETIKFDVKFNAITLWDVFEHIKCGFFYLNFMKSLLVEKSGLIFLQIPSVDALAARILQEKCNMFDGLEHVNLYGVNTIKKLANRCGLDVLDIRTVISEIGVINNYLSYDDPYLGGTDNKSHIPHLIGEKELHEHLMGYKMQVILGEAK